MRRLLLLMLLLPALLLTGVGSLQKTFVWQRVQTDVQARADGSLSVTETLTLRYTSGSFTFAFRDLPNRRLDRIDNITVRDQERTYQQVSDREGNTPYTFSIAMTNGAQRVRWVYPQTVGGTRTFMLSYDVFGAVRRDANADEIWWAMVFAQRDTIVEQAEGTIMLPIAAPAAQLQATTPDVAGIIERADGRATVRASNIAPGQELTLRLQFPKGVVGGVTPAWQTATAAQEQYNATVRPMVNVALSALAALLAVLLGAMIWRWWRRNRDPQPRGFVAATLPDPPDDLPPALVAKLTNETDWQALLATAVDLANRGFIEFHELPGGWFNKTPQLVLHRTAQSTADLAPFERSALDAIFDSQPEVILQDRAAEIMRIAGEEGMRYQAALVECGYLAPERLTNRKRGLWLGIALGSVGALAFVPAVFLAERVSWWMPIVTGVVTLMGFAWALVAVSVRGVTQTGADALARWRAFQRYLKRISAEVAPGGQFHHLLPYALALADVKGLARAYSQTDEPLPVWYYPIVVGHIHAGGGTVGNTLLLQDFSQNFVAALSSASSAGSVGGAAGGGGGASGGGGGGAG